MLGEVTHLQTILEDLTTLTMEPSKLPLASEQVSTRRDGTPPALASLLMSSAITKRAVCVITFLQERRFYSFCNLASPVFQPLISWCVCRPLQVILDLKGSDYNYTYQTPPASPSNTMSRKGSISR